MRQEKVIVIGTGNQAEVVIDIINQQNEYEIIGVTSLSADLEEFCGYPVLGNDSELKKIEKNNSFKLAMGIGGYRSNHNRKRVFESLKKQGFDFINVIHPHSSISKTARLGEGISVYAGAVINTAATIEDNVILALNSSVGHHSKIGKHSLLSAAASIGANAKVGDESLIAMGARLISGIKIGEKVTVAAGAVVVDSIESDKTVFGIPAKQKK